MFRKSPYLDALPIISVDLSRISAYHLRARRTPTDNIVPRKWPSPCWIWRAMLPAAAALGEHFTRFRTRYLAGKTQHKGSITAGQVENV